MPRPRPLLVLAALLAGLALLAGCAVGPSQRPAVATRGDDVPLVPDAGGDALPPPPPLLPPLLPSTPTGVAFSDCTSAVLPALAPLGGANGRDLRVGCGTLPVAGAGSTAPGEVGLTRVTLGPAPERSIPIAVLGDAQGRTGGAQALRLAARASTALLSGTALYGVDARGTGASEPVDCVTPTTRAAIDDADPRAGDAATLAPLQQAATTAARTCSQILEDAVTDYRTSTAADDLEQVRQALGAPRLHAVGLGDGAAVVADWSQRYPGSAGRTVLDGLPDPTTPALTRADQASDAAGRALAAFATDCTARPGCPLGADPVATVRDVVARLGAAPLPGADGRAVTDGTLVTALVDGLADPLRWPATADAVAAADRGDPAGVLAAIDAREADGAGFDLEVMTRCNDTGERLTVDQVAQAAARARAGDPVFGSWFAQQALVCSSWPVPTDPPAMPNTAGSPPLLIGSDADPRSPLPGSQRVAVQLQGATLVSWLGAGHGAYPATPCTTAVVEGFLLREEIPQQGTVCPP